LLPVEAYALRAARRVVPVAAYAVPAEDCVRRAACAVAPVAACAVPVAAPHVVPVPVAACARLEPAAVRLARLALAPDDSVVPLDGCSGLAVPQDDFAGAPLRDDWAQVVLLAGWAALEWGDSPAVERTEDDQSAAALHLDDSPRLREGDSAEASRLDARSLQAVPDDWRARLPVDDSVALLPPDVRLPPAVPDDSPADLPVVGPGDSLADLPQVLVPDDLRADLRLVAVLDVQHS